MEDGSAGSRAEFLARVQRFTDTLLDRLNEASKGRDVDEKEARMLGNVVLKLLRIWDKALLSGQRDPRLEDRLGQIRKMVPEVKS